jgi:PEP-CTERM/exosortase A-associated glycosyltransferase
MKILHVLDHSLPIGSGYSYRSRSITTFQKRLGLDPVILTSPKHGSQHDSCESLEGIRHYRTGRGWRPQLPFLQELMLMRRLAQRIGDVARIEKVSVIHAHSPLLNGLPALWAGRRLGVPVVYEVRTFWEDAAVNHGTFSENSLRYRISRALERVVLQRADALVAICQGIRAELLRRGIAAGRISVIPNGVDDEWLKGRPRATALGQRLGVAPGRPVFGYIGSFTPYEGLPFFADAAAGIQRSLSGGTILFVGSGRDEEAIREAARIAGSKVILTGRIPQDQVRDIYTLLDVLVLPRRRIRLTEMVTPLKPLEAMGVGVPVLASDIGGHAELIADGETGLLFKAESRESLVSQAVRLARDSGLRQELAANARRFVESERTWDRIAARYVPVYRSIT